MSSKPSSCNVEEKLLFDHGTRIGVAALIDEVARNQIENIIASLDTVEGREALLVTAAFARRQSERTKKDKKKDEKTAKSKEDKEDKKTAQFIVKALLELYEKGCGKEEAKKVLGFAKWIYEIGFTPSGNLEQLTLQEYLKQLASAGR
jgi:hypothetical protein